MSRPYSRWTDREIARAKKLKRLGMYYQDIDEALGKHRGSTGRKLRVLAMNPTEYDAHCEKTRAWRRRLAKKQSAQRSEYALAATMGASA